MQLPLQSFPKIKNKWLVIVPSASILLLIILTLFSKINFVAGNKWEKALATPELNKVINNNIDINDRISREFVASNIYVAKIGELTVYKFNYPEACGYGGCLHVVADPFAVSKPLQLWGKPIFTAGENPRSIVVEQDTEKHEIKL
jgi:hypothetical protein